MVGKTKFMIPDSAKLKLIQHEDAFQLQKAVATKLALHDLQQESQIYMVDLEKKNEMKTKQVISPLKEYIQHFQATEDMVGKEGKGKVALSGLALLIDTKVKTSLIKTNIAAAFSNIAKKNKEKKKCQRNHNGDEDGLHLPENQNKILEENMSIFNVVFSEESNSIKNIGKELLRRMEYQQKFKKNEITNDASSFGFDLEYDKLSTQNKSVDPRVQLFIKCKAMIESALPILDKVYRKTLCLQDYNLTPGHCQAIAVACQYFDEKLVNRVLFSNNGMNGDDFADILVGLQNLKDVKSIVYKQNGINKKAIEALEPLFKRKIPHHLLELRLMDIKSSASLIDDVIFKFSTCSQISKLALVNCQQSDKSFEILLNFIKSSRHLKELDLSWCTVRQNTFIKLLYIIKENRQLTHLNLSWNSFLDKQSLQLTKEEREAGKNEVELSPKNLQMMICFKEFVKYNLNLIELDLSNCKLNNPAILYLCYCLQRASSLRTLHLCGNMSRPQFRDQLGLEEIAENIEDEPFKLIIQKIQKRLKAKDNFIFTNIKQHDHHTAIDGPESKYQHHLALKKKQQNSIIEEGTSNPQTNQSQLSSNKTQNSDQMSAIERHKKMLAQMQFNPQKDQDKTNVEHLAWKHLRTGLRVRNIIASKRMHENKCQALNVEQKKLIITRQLGFKELIPGCAQWQILTKPNQECWVCSQWIFTFFIWTSRLGQLASINDPAKVNYYVDAIKRNEEDDCLSQCFETPHIGGPFNDWKWTKMTNMIEFCMQNDKNPPDFLKQLIESKEIRKEVGFPYYELMTEHESQVLTKFRRQYYQSNWPKMILKLSPMKKPCIANLESITSLSEEFDVTKEIYFYCSFVKPGRHDYVVRYTHHEPDRNDAEDAKGFKIPILKGKLTLNNLSQTQNNSIARKKNLKEREFYVHEFIASFRQEDIPQYHKERKMRKTSMEKYEAKEVFRDYKIDTNETVLSCFANDVKTIQFEVICNNDQSEIEKTSTKIRQNYKHIKKVFQYLQTKSKRYPLIDWQTLLKSFIEPSEILKNSHLSKNHIEVIYVDAIVDRGENEKHLLSNGLNRFNFTEFLCRIAKALYKSEDNFSSKKQDTLTIEDQDTNKANTLDIRLDKAIQMLVDNVMSKLQKNLDELKQEEFRKYDLWVESVELLYTMNEQNLKEVFSFLCKNKENNTDKPWNQEIVMMPDLHWFFRKVLQLTISAKQLQSCYVESKMTVVYEQEKEAQNKYKKLLYVEFLEFIARISIMLFAGSEMDELMLSQKIEHVLDEIFAYMGLTRVRQVIIIEEFSQSDDDY